MEVIIGVDPHKASHTAVAIGRSEDELASKKVRATRNQVPQLLAWAEPFPSRAWAIESAHGLGFLLAQQLVAAGETVIDVPATLVSRSRVLATGRSTKTDPNDALSVAVTALRNRSLRRVEPVDHRDLLRLLFSRNTDIGNQRSRVVSRLHALLIELQPGGVAREIKASDVHRFLEGVSPQTPVEQVRYDLATELLDEIEALDAQLKASHQRIRAAVERVGVGGHQEAPHARAALDQRSGARTAHRLPSAPPQVFGTRLAPGSHANESTITGSPSHHASPACIDWHPLAPEPSPQAHVPGQADID